jgi:hypothetical protein
MSFSSSMRESLEVVVAFVLPTLLILGTRQILIESKLDIPGPNPDGYAECQVSDCWILSNGSVVIHKLGLNERTPIRLGDSLITTTPNASLTAALRHAQGQFKMVGLSILKVQAGRMDLDLKPEEAERQDAIEKGFPNIKQKEIPQVLFIGGLPVHINNPIPKSEIVIDHYPTQLRFAFTLPDQAIKSGRSKAFATWRLERMNPDKNFATLGSFETQTTETKDGVLFMTDIRLPTPGVYALSPLSSDIDLSQSEKLTFTAKPRKDLDNQIKALIDKARDNQNGASFEIRQ